MLCVKPGQKSWQLPLLWIAPRVPKSVSKQKDCRISVPSDWLTSTSISFYLDLSEC